MIDGYIRNLIISNQVEIKVKDLLKNFFFIGIILVVAFVLNIIFNTRFFGLCLNDKYNIYGHKIFDNYYVSNIAYLGGLIIVMFLGYFAYKLIKNKLKV